MFSACHKLIREFVAGFPAQAPIRARQRAVYWGVLLLATLLAGFSSWYIQRIPQQIHQQVSKQLEGHPETREMLLVDGRDVALRGELESLPGFERDLAQLQDLEGVRSLTDDVKRVVRPSPELRMIRSEERINLDGRLNGTDLDIAIAQLRRSFTLEGLRDRIRIDDRLGKLPWLNHAGPLLGQLKSLQSFSLYAWRDAILLDATVDSASSARQLKYTVNAALDPAVTASFQLRVEPPADTPQLSLVSGWNGTAFHARLPDDALATHYDQVIADWQGDGQQTGAASTSIIVDPTLAHPHWLDQLAPVLPVMAQVHDLRLATSDSGLIAWGRVDSPQLLGTLITAIDDAGLGDIIDNRILVDPAKNRPEISLFRDPHLLVVSGRLPSEHARRELLAILETGLSVEAIEDFINIEPNIAFSPWLENWSILLPVIPRSAFGLTIADETVLICRLRCPPRP